MQCKSLAESCLTLSVPCCPMHTSTQMGPSICATNSCASLVIDRCCGQASPSESPAARKGIRESLLLSALLGEGLAQTFRLAIGSGVAITRKLPIMSGALDANLTSANREDALEVLCGARTATPSSERRHVSRRSALFPNLGGFTESKTRQKLSRFLARRHAKAQGRGATEHISVGTTGTFYLIS
jgi:hypothetical protein